MRTHFRSRLFALVLPGVLLAIAASAQAPMREFTGRIDRIDESRMVVDNRMHDRITFVRADPTTVKGERKEWSGLRTGDRVTVFWRFVDKPKKAYVVRVLPPRSKRR